MSPESGKFLGEYEQAVADMDFVTQGEMGLIEFKSKKRDLQRAAMAARKKLVERIESMEADILAPANFTNLEVRELLWEILDGNRDYRSPSGIHAELGTPMDRAVKLHDIARRFVNHHKR